MEVFRFSIEFFFSANRFTAFGGTMLITVAAISRRP